MNQENLSDLPSDNRPGAAGADPSSRPSPAGGQHPPTPPSPEAGGSDSGAAASPWLTDDKNRRREEQRRRSEEILQEFARFEKDGVGKEVSHPEVEAKPFSELLSTEIDWLWWLRVPFGKLTLIAGEPGVGKSSIACRLAAAASLGVPMIEGEPVAKVGSIYFSSEDNASDTLRPRLGRFGADLSMVLWGANELTGEDRASFNLFRHAAYLEAMLDRHRNVKLLIFDPIQAYIGAASNDGIRSGLSKICSIAERHKVAIVGITHLRKDGSKSPADVLGASALAAVARAVWLVARDPFNKGACLMSPMKLNLAGATSLRYRIVDGNLTWDPEPVDDCGAAGGVADQGARHEEEQWVISELKAGRNAAKHLQSEAKAAGFSKRTLDRVKADLKIKSKRTAEGWFWVLPEGK